MSAEELKKAIIDEKTLYVFYTNKVPKFLKVNKVTYEKLEDWSMIDLLNVIIDKNLADDEFRLLGEIL